MKSSAFVYIAGPITARNGFMVEDNVLEGLKAFLELIRLGIPAFAPQLVGAFPSAFDINYLLWTAYDLCVIDRCTHVLMLPRWNESPGARNEKAYAETRHMPIAYSIKELVDMLDERSPS